MPKPRTPTHPKVDAYFAKAKRWQAESEALRAILLDCGLEEALKWGKPCYAFEGNNIAIIQKFEDFVALLFFKGALLEDPKGLLEQQGANTRSAKRLCFTDAKQVGKRKAAIKRFVRQAIDVEKAGKTVPKPKLVLAKELKARLAQDPKLRKAFEALTPGRQREYNLYVSGAKQSKTREARVEKHVKAILAGRGLRDRPDATAKKKTSKTKASKKKTSKKPKLLAGGNPQIPKGDGDAPVQAYIAAMPGWKRDVGRRLDAIIVKSAPKVQKAVKWNSPFYGIDGQGWFLNFHCFTKYVKVAFFRGTSLRPVPPVESKHDEARYLHVHEGDAIDEAQLRKWIRQAARLPGWIP